MKDERRSQYAWRGVLRRVPQFPLASGPPSPGDATFLTPVLVCPVPEGRVEYLSQACAAKPMDAAEGRGALRALRRGLRRPRCRRLPRAKLHLGLARRKDVDALDLGVDAVGDDRGAARVRCRFLEVPAPEVGVAHDADVAERALGRSVGRPRIAEVPEEVALVGAEQREEVPGRKADARHRAPRASRQPVVEGEAALVEPPALAAPERLPRQLDAGRPPDEALWAAVALLEVVLAHRAARWARR